MRRRFAIYNFDDKVMTLLLDKKYQLVKFFYIDMYLDSRSRVASFYQFLTELRDKCHEGLSLDDLKIYQLQMVKTKEYHDEVIDIINQITNIDKISFDMLRLSKIRDEYCISNDVLQTHEQVIDFFSTVSDNVPEYIKLFQIKGVKSMKKVMEFLET